MAWTIEHLFVCREELHAIASAKKLSSKNKALNELRNYRRDVGMEEDGPSFEQGSQVINIEIVLLSRTAKKESAFTFIHPFKLIHTEGQKKYKKYFLTYEYVFASLTSL